jgi:hypothetical protein
MAFKFDKSRDKLIQHLGEIDANSGSKIEVDLRSYDEGEPKVSMSRTYGEKHTRLGRLTIKEAYDLTVLLDNTLFPDGERPE